MVQIELILEMQNLEHPKNESMPIHPVTRRNILQDQSLWILLLSNSATIFFALQEQWSIATVMLVYWCQSIVIGIFNFIRILELKEFSTEGFLINNQPVGPTEATKNSTAYFFLFHYGFFHVGYFVFLLSRPFSGPAGIDFIYVFLIAGIFFVNHLFSYFYNKPRDTKKQNIGNLMFYPYLRIIPMHLSIIFGSSASIALPFFLLLKTFADLGMHIVEHNVLRKGEAQNV